MKRSSLPRDKLPKGKLKKKLSPSGRILKRFRQRMLPKKQLLKLALLKPNGIIPRLSMNRLMMRLMLQSWKLLIARRPLAYEMETDHENIHQMLQNCHNSNWS